MLRGYRGFAAKLSVWLLKELRLFVLISLATVQSPEQAATLYASNPARRLRTSTGATTYCSKTTLVTLRGALEPVRLEVDLAIVILATKRTSQRSPSAT
jgi:hypothetical protein